jgi:hypothetical protein
LKTATSQNSCVTMASTTHKVFIWADPFPCRFSSPCRGPMSSTAGEFTLSPFDRHSMTRMWS